MVEGPPSVFSTSSRSRKLFTSIAIFYCNVTLGINMTFLNPTMLDFSRKFDTTVEDVSVVFTLITAAYLVGALVAGVVHSFLNRQVWVLICVSLEIIPFIVIPFTNSKYLFFAVSALMGFGGGGYDCAQVAWVIDIWRHSSGPYILIAHFAYSAGTLIPPLVLAPFLAEEVEDTTERSTTPGNERRRLLMDADWPESTSDATPYESQMGTPFAIAAAFFVFQILVQLVLLGLYKPWKPQCGTDFEMTNQIREKNGISCSSPEKNVSDLNLKKNVTDANPEKNEIAASNLHKNDIYGLNIHKNVSDANVEKSVSDSTPEKLLQDPLKRRILLVVLCCCVIGFYQGLELCTSQFMPTFAHFSEVGLSEAASARVSLGLQLGFAGGRLVGIFLVLKVAPHLLLAGNQALLLAANIILLAVGGTDVTWLWVGAVSIGVGMSTVYPALYAYIEKYLFITDRIAAIVAVSGGLVSAIYPLIVKKFVEENPAVMTYVNFVSIVACVSAFSYLYGITHVRAKLLRGK